MKVKGEAKTGGKKHKKLLAKHTADVQIVLRIYSKLFIQKEDVRRIRKNRRQMTPRDVDELCKWALH